ncbi:MAG TPA: hypothetical protein QF433_03540, partial [Candidatus Thalassarchaeaceae archaeon]|nr:hypothetical protein [Candidatus Thalassarchaeaceae archaeon]
LILFLVLLMFEIIGLCWIVLDCVGFWGIGQAIVSGKFAAESIISNLQNDAPLTDYNKILSKTMAKQLKISRRSKNLFWTFCRNDFTTELAMRLLGTNGLRRAVDCRRPLIFL